MAWPLYVALPHLDGWSFVLQYQRWMEGRYEWKDFFEPHYLHPSAVGKSLYFAVLHWFGGDVRILSLLMWLVAAVIAGCVCHLGRPLWRARPVWGTVLMLLVGMTIFSAAQGEVWLWDFLFQNSMPGMCLALGIVVLMQAPVTIWRILAAGLLCTVAVFSFGAGPLVAVLLAPLIWLRLEGQSLTRRNVVTAVWLVVTGIVAYLALRVLGGAPETASAGILLDRPLMRLHFILIVLGQMLGKGTVFEPHTLCALWGGGLLLVFTACLVHVIRRRQDRVLLLDALPWILFALYGLGNAVLICVARSFNSTSNALEERYSALTMFFIFGTLLLAAVVVRHAQPMPVLIRWVRVAAVPALTILFTALVVNWGKGWDAMQIKHQTMEQERAMLAFVNVLPPSPEWMGQRLTRKSTLSMTKYLGSQDRVPDMKFARDTRVASFPQGKKAPSQWARLDKPVLLEDGRWNFSGIGGLSPEEAADLIVVTVESPGVEERIFTLAAPFLPETTLEREAQTRRYPGHYMGWSQVVPSTDLPGGAMTFRAYVFEQKEHRLRPIEGVHKVGMPAT